MGKHEFTPLRINNDDRKWITHQWNTHWKQWEWSERLIRQEIARKSRAAYLGTETEAGNHSFAFRYLSKNRGLSDYILLPRFCTMASDGTKCFHADNLTHGVCGHGDYNLRSEK
jgi:hypothetical protein